jgi:hypothetical protein
METNTKPVRGIESLQASVIRDTQSGENCFNPNGCDKIATETVPETNPKLIEMGIKNKCVKRIKCFHQYCDTYKWVIDRAAHYAEILGTTSEEILTKWESELDYWYMNYYQEGKQPILDKEGVRVFDTIDAMQETITAPGFRCPKCDGVSRDAYMCTYEDCNWKVYGLFGHLGKGVSIVIKKPFVMDVIFMPVSWETPSKS